MREILFRGKRVDNGEWEYGSLVIQNGEHISKTEVAPDEYYIFGKRGEHCLINPSTAGQYTGLTDKNGRKIFEGDIVKCSCEKTDNIALAVIKYGSYTDVESLSDYDYLGWCLEKDKNCISILYPENDGIEMEVIGNIYDNPELLEE